MASNVPMPMSEQQQRMWEVAQYMKDHPEMSDKERQDLAASIGCRIAFMKGSKKLADQLGSKPTKKQVDRFLEQSCTFLGKKLSAECAYPDCTTGQRPETLKKCGGCKKAMYCGLDCQTAHWPEHRSVCKLPSK